MTSAPAPACPAILAEASISVASRSGMGNRLAFVAAAIVLLLLCAGRIAPAQTAYFSGAQTTVGSGYHFPTGVAADSNGNVYVADALNNAVKEVLAVNGSIPASPTIRTLGSGFSTPEGVAVDGGGNVYVADTYNGAVKEIVAVNGSIPASPTIRTLTSVELPFGVAVDGSGNVYFTGGCPGGAGAYSCGDVIELPAINGSVPANPSEIVWEGNFGDPTGIAVDGNGNVYVGNTGFNQIDEIVAVNGSVSQSSIVRTLATFSGSTGVVGVAVDAIGNVYAVGQLNSTVYELLSVNGSIPASPAMITLGTGFNYPGEAAVNRNGNLYVADIENNRVVMLSLSSANFGAVNIGTTSPAIPMTFTFASPGTLESAAALTQGAIGMDFADAGTGTCTAEIAYTASQTCTVNVTFTPKFTGTRYGAAVLYGSSGNAIATAYLNGTGMGPQVAFAPASQMALGSGYSNPMGTAVNGNGNVYVADETHGQIKEILAVGGRIPSAPVVNILGSGFSYPHGVAVNGAGNVYVADEGNGAVKEILSVNGSIPAAPTILTLAGGLSYPWAIAVDGNGNVFFTEPYNNAVEEILAVDGSIPASPVIKPIGSGFNYPFGVAVDSGGNVYIGDTYNSAVKEILEVNGSVPASPTIKTLSSSFYYPGNMAVDGIGNVYVSDFGDNTVKEIQAVHGSIPVSPIIVTLASGFNFPFGVAVDSGFNLYVGDTQNNRILELDFADPPSLSFASTVNGSTSSDSPQTVTLENAGNASLIFPIPAAGNNPSIAANFTLDDNGGPACPDLNAGSPAWGTLAAGASCQLSISFIPQAAGSLSGSVVLTDNNLGAAAPGYATQTIILSGTGTTPATPQITWAQPGAITYGTTLGATQLNASSPVPGSFAYSPAAGAVLTAGTQTLTVTFTPTDTADYTTATATVSLAVNLATPAVTWGAPSAITYGTALSGTQLNATSAVAGSFTYSPAAGTVLAAGVQILTITFTPTDTADYTGATATTQLTVNKATPAITWPAPAPIPYGVALGATQLDATSTVAGTFTYSPAAGTVPTPGVQTLTVTFTPTDSVDYAPVTQAAMLTVNKAPPPVTWATPAAIVYGRALSGTQLDASSTIAGKFIYSPAAGTVLTAGMQTLTAAFTPTNTTDYATAAATVALVVNQATPVITWSKPAAITQGTALSATQLDATSTVPGIFTYSPAAGTVLDAGSQTLATTFTPTDTTDYTTATRSVVLTVHPAPTFTLSASPGSLSVTQGASRTSTITLTAKNGFSTSATLTASGLPSGVTASFSTNPITDSSVITFTASSTATVGSATVTITGTSGSLTVSKTIALAVKQLR